MIDLCRLLAAFSPDAFSGVGEVEQFIKALLKAAEWLVPWSLPLSKSRETNILLVLRTLANITQKRTQLSSTQYSLVCPSTSSIDTPPYKDLNQIFEALGHVPYTLLTKVQRVAFSTILFKQVTT